MIRALAVSLFVALPFAVAAQTVTTSDAPPDTPDVTVSGDVDSAAKAGETGKRQEDSPPQKQVYVQASADNGENDEGGWRWWVGIAADGAAIVSSIVLALAGIAGLRYLRGQVAAMEQNNRDTQEHNERTLAAMQETNKLTRDSNEVAARAFRHGARARLIAVKFRSLGDHPIFSGGRYYPISITVENVGNADASVTLRAGLFYSRFLARITPQFFTKFAELIEGAPATPPRPKCEDLPLGWSEESIPLRKGGSAEFVVWLSAPPAPPPEIEAFDAGALQAHVVGCLLSRDELGETRKTLIGATHNTFLCKQQNPRFGQPAKEGELPVYYSWEWQPTIDNNREEQEDGDQAQS